MLSTILGGGIVGIPSSFYNLGLPFAIGLNIAMLFITYGSAKLYMRVKDILPDEPESLYEIGYMCFGKTAIYFVSAI